MSDNKKKYNDESEIDLHLFLNVLKNKLVWILLVAVLFATVAGIYTVFFITPQYRTTISFSITSSNAGTSSSTGDLASSIADNININDYLAENIVEALGDGHPYNDADSVQNGEWSLGNGSNMSLSYVKNRVHASANGNIVTVNVISINPYEAFEMAKAVNYCGLDYYRSEGHLPGTVSISPNIILTAPSTSPYSPSIRSNVTIAGVIGFVLMYVVFLIVALVDTKIYTDEDLKKYFDIPILGQIPEWDDN